MIMQGTGMLGEGEAQIPKLMYGNAR